MVLLKHWQTGKPKQGIQVKQISKTFLFLILLVLSRSSLALTSEEKSCITKTTFIECRDKRYCNTKAWESILSVILNRQEAFPIWKFGAKSRNACNLVASKEFSGFKLLKTKVKEPIVYLEIKNFFNKQGWKSTNSFLYFNPVKAKMNLHGNVRTLIRGKR